MANAQAKGGYYLGANGKAHDAFGRSVKRIDEAVAAEKHPIEKVSLAELPEHLAGIDSAAELRELAAADSRKGAAEFYKQRIADVERNAAGTAAE